MEISLNGRGAVVTAGAAGIGLAIAELMVACGARVHICDIDTAALDAAKSRLPGSVTTSVLDVSNSEGAKNLLMELERDFGGLDILVNNAGIAGVAGPIEQLDPTDLRRILAVNLEGQFYLARSATPLLKKSKAGAIINISSAAGRLGYANRANYSASKWGVVGFTRSLAAELGPFGIRVNAICPGAVDGPPLRRAIAARASKRGISEKIALDEYLSQSSMRILISEKDVANLAAFLSSDWAKHISGQVIGVDGDTTILI